MGIFDREEVLDYIIDSYAGTEPHPKSGRERRLYLWEEEGEVHMGNTEAFVLHLGRRFRVEVNTFAASRVHAVLRELGERVNAYPEQRTVEGRKIGKFRQPEPEEWRIN
jgi:hypothetical protein